MNVDMITYTGAGTDDPADYAASVLIFAKNTRVAMSPNGFREIREWPMERKLEELAYIANTIPASHEFVDYTFICVGVTRAFTHQLVRTRTASYAQQTHQVLDLSAGWDYLEGKAIADDEDHHEVYERTMASIAAGYRWLVENGARVEDARGLLPTHVLTNIVVKMNLRTIVDLLHSRVSPRNLGEFRDVAVLLRDRVLEVHPWASLFLDRTTDRAFAELDEMITVGVPNKNEANRMHKLVDQLRRKS